MAWITSSSTVSRIVFPIITSKSTAFRVFTPPSILNKLVLTPVSIPINFSESLVSKDCNVMVAVSILDLNSLQADAVACKCSLRPILDVPVFLPKLSSVK